MPKMRFTDSARQNADSDNAAAFTLKRELLAFLKEPSAIVESYMERLVDPGLSRVEESSLEKR